MQPWRSAIRAPWAERSPMLVAAVATRTVALARSWRTSGRCVASDMIVMPPMECPASTTSQTSVASSTSAKSWASVANSSGAEPRGAQPVPPLVVEHDAESLFAKTTGDRKPDLVTAAPAVGENDHRRVVTVALDVPHGELRAVRGPHDMVLWSAHALAPTESRERPVVELVSATSGDPCSGETAGTPPRRHGRGHGRTDDQESPRTGRRGTAAGAERQGRSERVSQGPERMPRFEGQDPVQRPPGAAFATATTPAPADSRTHIPVPPSHPRTQEIRV